MTLDQAQAQAHHYTPDIQDAFQGLELPTGSPVRSSAGMTSKILGQVRLDEQLLAADLAKLQDSFWSSSYSDYALGVWKTCVLANQSGSHLQGDSIEYTGSAMATELGKQQLYLLSVVENTFHWNHVKSVRLFSSKNGGLIIPHRDYLEFSQGFTRIHIPLVTDPLCLNSEGPNVYHMRRSEVWFLDGRRVHSGGSFGKTGKISLVVDFDPSVALADLFKDSGVTQVIPAAYMVERPALSQAVMDGIRSMALLIHSANVADILALLSKIHFFHDVDCAKIYDWVDKIALLTGDQGLVEQSRFLRMKFLGEAK